MNELMNKLVAENAKLVQENKELQEQLTALLEKSND